MADEKTTDLASIATPAGADVFYLADTSVPEGKKITASNLRAYMQAGVLFTDGSRAMAGNLDMGGNAITNVGNVDGVDVSAHAARHILDGGDEIDGDQLGISWNPSVYSPSTSPTQVSNVDHLTAHLAGIDSYLGGLTTGVSSVFGRTGAVTAQASDYDASQVDDDSSLASASVAAALDSMLLLDGSRAMTGGFDMGGFAVSAIAAGSALSPSVAASGVDAGLAWAIGGGDDVSLVAGGAEILRADATPQVLHPAGTFSAPGISFLGRPQDGIAVESGGVVMERNSGGTVVAARDNQVDFKESGVLQASIKHIGTNAGNVSANFTPTTSVADTEGWTALLVNPDTSSDAGSGPRLLADFQDTGTSVAQITQDGSVAASANAKSEGFYFMGAANPVLSTFRNDPGNMKKMELRMPSTGDSAFTAVRGGACFIGLGGTFEDVRLDIDTGFPNGNAGLNRQNDIDTGIVWPADDEVGFAAGKSIIAKATTSAWAPHNDNAYSLGTASKRWSDVHAVQTTIGDLHMGFKDSPSRWTLREGPGRIEAVNRDAGAVYEVELKPLDEAA